MKNGKHGANDTVSEMVRNLLIWAKTEDYQSFDWWDLWNNGIGSKGKYLYAKYSYLGLPLVASLLAIDFLYPNIRRHFAKKRPFAISYAHFGIGYLNLYAITKDESFLKEALNIADRLLAIATATLHGYGWGIDLHWITNDGVIPANIPCHSQTAYVYDYFVELFTLTKELRYKDLLKQIAAHEAYDFKEWVDDKILISSYSMVDEKKVVNANSYRMYMLADAGIRFDNSIYIDKSTATMNYIIQSQNSDGSWFYSENEHFVDHYHTCFVLKNLIRTKKILFENDDRVKAVISKGLNYYFANLFDKQGYPIPFSVKPRILLYKYDSYDLAEAINLLVEVNHDLNHLQYLIEFAESIFYNRKKGWFRFRKYHFPKVEDPPYIRYANSAMFLALTKTLKLLKDFKNDSIH